MGWLAILFLWIKFECCRINLGCDLLIRCKDFPSWEPLGNGICLSAVGGTRAVGWNLISDLWFFAIFSRDFTDIEGSAPSCGWRNRFPVLFQLAKKSARHSLTAHYFRQAATRLGRQKAGPSLPHATRLAPKKIVSDPGSHCLTAAQSIFLLSLDSSHMQLRVNKAECREERATGHWPWFPVSLVFFHSITTLVCRQQSDAYLEPSHLESVWRVVTSRASKRRGGVMGIWTVSASLLQFCPCKSISFNRKKGVENCVAMWQLQFLASLAEVTDACQPHFKYFARNLCLPLLPGKGEQQGSMETDALHVWEAKLPVLFSWKM